MIAALLGAAQERRSGALVMRGAAGLGKSAVLDHAATTAGEMGILRLDCVAAESEIAFAGLGELLQPGLGLRDQLPQPQREALETALALSPPSPGERFAVGAATLTLLAAAAEESALLVLIDDAQHLDAESAQALGFAMRRLGHEGVAVIVAAAGGDARWLARLPATELQPLSRDEARMLLGLRAATSPAEGVADRILDETSGVPLAIVTAATALSVDQLTGRAPLPIPLPAPDDLAQQLLAEANRLSTGGRSLLMSVAVADTRSLPVIARLAEDDGMDRMIDAERRGLLQIDSNEVGFASPLVRSALYHAATPQERREGHRRVAEALVEPRYRDRRAVHLGKATVTPDAEVAAELEWAGESFRRRVGYGTAAAAFRRAADLSESAPDRDRRYVLAAWAAWDSGAPGDAAAMLEQVGSADDGVALQADVQHLKGLIAIRSGGVAPEISRDLEAAAAGVEAAEPARAAALLITAAEVLAPEERIPPLEHAVALAQPVAARLWLRASLSLAVALADAGRGDEAAAIASEALPLLDADDDCRDDPELLALAAASAGTAAPEPELCARSVAAARRRAALAVLPQALLLLARAREADGAWTESLDALTEAGELADASGQELQQWLAVAGQARLHALRGDTTACEAVLALLEALPGRAADREPLAETAAGMLSLARGDAKDARSRLGRRIEMPDGAFALDTAAQVTPDLAEALVLLGQSDDASAVLETPGPQAGVPAWLGLRIAAAQALATGDAEAAVDVLAQAGDMRPPHPYHRARIELACGRMLRRGGKVARSRDPLRGAVAGFDSTGATAWAEQARHELAATNEHPGPRDVANRDRLTPQERHIADLVVAGLTDKEIGAQLFVSAKTVSYHLDKVYKKLGCTKGRGRKELPAKLAEMGEVA